MAAPTWLLYLALEPIVRRNMPELIVSWNRLLAGDWRDPLVGRDVLLGTVLAIAHTALIYLTFLTERLFYNDLKTFTDSNSLIGLRSSMSIILTGAGGGILSGFTFVCLLVILFLVLRRKLYAGIVLFAIIATIEGLVFSDSIISLFFTSATAAIMCLIVSRLGLVATIVANTVRPWMIGTLLTLNFSAWYATPMLVTLALTLFLLGYGFKVSIANRPLFGRGSLERG
jgi:serine/threonine-protein kinase